MGISEKVAYIKGLMEGMKFDATSDEGKLIAAIVDLLDDMAFELEDMEEEIIELGDGMDVISDDLADVEDVVYEEEDDEQEECFVTTCPECEEEIFFDETLLEDGEVICPNCGAKLEFDLSDLANETLESEE